ncbi:histidine kinase [Naasia aerilata]|nr:histidine kinase [Naasia aerilata]
MSPSRPVGPPAPTGGRSLRLPTSRWFAGLLVILATLVAVVVVDVVLLAVAGPGLGERGAAILAAIGVTLCVAPLHDRLTEALHRLLTGRTDTFEVLSTLAARLAQAQDEGGRLGDLVAVVAEGFAARYVEVSLRRRDGSLTVAREGRASGEPVVVPLEYRGSVFGELRLEPGRRLTRRDRVLLTDLVRLAAAAIVTAETSDELQRIRTRLVLAREDERQRLRGDLHDHLVPLLETLAAHASSSRDTLAPGRTQEARDHLQSAVRGASAAVDDIRRVAQDLRPPALDDLGLGKALDQLAARFAARIPELELAWELPGERPPLWRWRCTASSRMPWRRSRAVRAAAPFASPWGWTAAC